MTDVITIETMPSTYKQATTWLVIDSRIARIPNVSSESRFTYGLINALTEKLEEKKTSSQEEFAKVKLLLIANDAPSQWMIELITKYPDSASFWCGGPGFLQKKTNKVSWFWATRVFKIIQKITENRFVWLSPSNLDRPLFISKNPISKKIIQIIQNPIPLLNVSGMGFFFKFQFKFITKRSINNLENIITTSNFAHETLSKINKRKASRIVIIRDSVDKIFGYKKKINDRKELFQKREDFFNHFYPDTSKEVNKIIDEKRLFINTLLNGQWCLGIGKNKKYKNWDVVQTAITKLASKDYVNLNLWFIRLGYDQKELNLYMKKAELIEFGAIKAFPNLRTILVPQLSDLQLADLYSYCDINLCPSTGESYGLSSLEAVFSGTPTIYKSGTVIDDHFTENSLPTNYWCRVDSISPSVWANQIERIIQDKKDSHFYQELYANSSARAYITSYSRNENFSWNQQSEKFFEFLFRKNKFQEYSKIV